MTAAPWDVCHHQGCGQPLVPGKTLCAEHQAELHALAQAMDLEGLKQFLAGATGMTPEQIEPIFLLVIERRMAKIQIERQQEMRLMHAGLTGSVAHEGRA